MVAHGVLLLVVVVSVLFLMCQGAPMGVEKRYATCIPLVVGSFPKFDYWVLVLCSLH